MSPISRRDFLHRSTTAAIFASLAPLVAELRAAASPYGWPIGIQIFPLAKMIDTDFRGTMKQVAEAGFQTVELLSPWYNKHNFGLADMERYSGQEIQKILGDLGLKAIGAHVDMTECRGEELPKIIQWAKDRGLRQICVPSLDGPRNGTMDDVKRLAAEYNHAGEMSAKAGLKQGLHTEGFELSMIDGKRVFDILLDGYLDPKLVRFQFQMSTLSSGLVAADYFTKHPGRFLSMHLQDVDMNTEVPGRNGRGTSHPQKPIGQGSIDWVKTFTAAKVGGVENFFVEQNLELAKAGVPFLKGLKV
jgi:sugar phosphate isomerase/epimerase